MTTMEVFLSNNRARATYDQNTNLLGS